MLTSWRIAQAKNSMSAFNGEGAKRYPGRWNLKGIPVIYTAGSASLAALELLVHLESADVLDSYVLIPVSYDKKLVKQIEKLPLNWKDFPAPPDTQLIGNSWAVKKESLILAVPSAIIDIELNFIINPLHPDMGKIKIGDPISFKYDSRLKK
jgi:RES domain-containing protein